MRWESDNGHSPVPTAKVWGTQKEHGFGEGPILDTPFLTMDSVRYSSDDELKHYGIPGMKWGVRAKEYVKKGYNIVARRMAIQKMKRKAESRRQFEEGYNRGQRVASNTYFIKKRVNRMLAEKQARLDAEKGDRLDRMIDKTVDKVVDKSGIGKMAKDMGFNDELIRTGIDKAKDFLKDFKNNNVDKLLDWADSEKGQSQMQSVANFIGKSTSKSIGVGMKAAPYVKKGAKAAARVAAKGGKKAAKAVAKSAVSGYKWLRNGGAKKIKNAASKTARILSKTLNRGSDILRESYKNAHKGSRTAKRKMDDLLTRRPKRHG